MGDYMLFCKQPRILTARKKIMNTAKTSNIRMFHADYCIFISRAIYFSNYVRMHENQRKCSRWYSNILNSCLTGADLCFFFVCIPNFQINFEAFAPIQVVQRALVWISLRNIFSEKSNKFIYICFIRTNDYKFPYSVWRPSST